ncbi:hypothetical protein ACWDSJ_13915 [Nocardia sp. NPDC003482]
MLPENQIRASEKPDFLVSPCRRGLPQAPTPAQVDTARGYLRACVEQHPDWIQEHTAWVDTLSDGDVVAYALRFWPQGWNDFCNYFAHDIRNTETVTAVSGGDTTESEL